MKKYLQHPNIHTYDASDSPLFPVFNEYGQPLLIEPGQPLPRYYLLTRKIFFFLSMCIFLLHLFLQITFMILPGQEHIIPYFITFISIESMMFLHAWYHHLQCKHQKKSWIKKTGYALWSIIVLLTVISSLFFFNVLRNEIQQTSIESLDISAGIIVFNALAGSVVFLQTFFHDWKSRLSPWTKNIDTKITM